MNDMEILASIQEDKRFTQDPGLGDFFDDIGEGIENIWKSTVGTAANEGSKAVEKGVKTLFGNNEGGSQTPYDDMNQLALPTEQKPSTEEKAKTFIQKVPPVVVGAGTTVLVKYVGKFGWITSIAAGAVAGGAKYYFIDKKGV